MVTTRAENNSIRKLLPNGELGDYDECYYQNENQNLETCGDTCSDIPIENQALTANECLDLRDKLVDTGLNCALNNNNNNNNNECLLYNICEYSKIDEIGLNISGCEDKKKEYHFVEGGENPYECINCEDNDKIWGGGIDV